MRKALALVVAVLFVASAIPVFAGGDAPASKEKCKINVTLPFQIIADTMKPGKIRQKNQLRPILQKVDTFQEMSNSIEEGSAKARKESLRTTK